MGGGDKIRANVGNAWVLEGKAKTRERVLTRKGKG